MLTQPGSVESGPRPVTADTIDPRNNDQTPYVDEDDEMEDNADFYRSPSKSTSSSVSSSVWFSTPPPPVALRRGPRQERSNEVTADLTERSKNDTYGQYTQLLKYSFLKLTHHKFPALKLSTSRSIGVVASLEATTSTEPATSQTKIYTSSNPRSAR